MPLIPLLLADHLRLQIDLVLSDSIVDIVSLGIDVAIRIATLRDSELVTRPLAPNPRVLSASPAYLVQQGGHRARRLTRASLHSPTRYAALALRA